MPRPGLLFRLSRTLRVNQRELAELLGCSTRTVIRGGGVILPGTYAKLAASVHPLDRAFAAELAHEAGQTLVGLGLESPTNRERGPTSSHLADSVLCAAAEAMQTSPHAMRPALVAAFERVVALGMTAEEALNGMAGAPRAAGEADGSASRG